MSETQKPSLEEIANDLKDWEDIRSKFEAKPYDTQVSERIGKKILGNPAAYANESQEAKYNQIIANYSSSASQFIQEMNSKYKSLLSKLNEGGLTSFALTVPVLKTEDSKLKDIAKQVKIIKEVQEVLEKDDTQIMNEYTLTQFKTDAARDAFGVYESPDFIRKVYAGRAAEAKRKLMIAISKETNEVDSDGKKKKIIDKNLLEKYVSSSIDNLKDPEKLGVYDLLYRQTYTPKDKKK